MAQLVERARQHLQAECLRLHAEGEPLLVGTLSGDDLLPGTGTLTLAPDERPLLQALTQDRPVATRLLGLRIDARTSLHIDSDLHVHERRHTLDLRPGKRPGDLALQFTTGTQAGLITY